ncbi:DUF695 domain-containing protein [Parafilimonas sp.]|uniref:DUF695 domain-containing protein n=1 Tax=Parafilimonas sp. TaxID=1969739 RepID=UPI0039E267CD
MWALKNIFFKKFQPSGVYQNFWNWFQKNEKEFHAVIKNKSHIEEVVVNPLSAKLHELGKEIHYLTGMNSSTTVELILTANGVIKNIAFVEELVKAAPKIKGWKFTALKPAIDIKDIAIDMSGYTFKSENIWFYVNERPEYPDEIDIVVVHEDFTDDNRQAITNGVHTFLDKYIGELNFAVTIDNLKVTGKRSATRKLIPVEKLRTYLKWREKEFVEKYDDVRRNTQNDQYATLKAQLKNGSFLIATMNMDLLEWDRKASHPWIGAFGIKYKSEHNHGMPDKATSVMLNMIEEKICDHLKCHDGYLNVGRQTAEDTREIYFACKDFRKPSIVFDKVKEDFADKFEISYNIYKDKYWRSFDRFKETK